METQFGEIYIQFNEMENSMWLNISPILKTNNQLILNEIQFEKGEIDFDEYLTASYIYIFIYIYVYQLQKSMWFYFIKVLRKKWIAKTRLLQWFLLFL